MCSKTRLLKSLSGFAGAKRPTLCVTLRLVLHALRCPAECGVCAVCAVCANVVLGVMHVLYVHVRFDSQVALSVMMTTITTLGAIVMTPLLCKLLLGTVVPVDAVGIAFSTIQVRRTILRVFAW